MSQPLSPDTQKVLSAAHFYASGQSAKFGVKDDTYWCHDAVHVTDPAFIAAATLRAAAEQSENLYDAHEGKVSVVRAEKLRAMATELEGLGEQLAN